MAADNPIAEDQLAEAIRSLVNHFVPLLKESTSVEQAEEILRNAEETDENFHKLDVVALLTSRIESGLSMVLDKEFERQKINERPVQMQLQLQERIVSNIMQSSVYADLRQEIIQSTKLAVQRLCNDYIDEEHEMARDSDKQIGSANWIGGPTEGLVSSKRGGGTQYSFSEDSSVGGSSYNHSGFGFIGLERFKQIVAGLDPKNSTEVRRTAMGNLCRLNPADILDEVQNPLKSVILDALSDSDVFVSDKAFAYTAKLLSNTCVSLTKSAYASFVDHVTTQFNSRKAHQHLGLKNGLSVVNPLMSRILTKFRLLCDFHQQVSKYWIRYPSEYLMETVITNTISLLSTNVSGGSKDDKTDYLTPIHFLSLLDPVALWFKTWIHGAFSRDHMLEELTKNRSLIESVVICCFNYYTVRTKTKSLEELDVKATPRNGEDVTYSTMQLEFLRFVHSLCILTHLLRFKKGRDLFPVKHKVSGETITVERLLLNLLQFVIDPLAGSMKPAKKSDTSDRNISPLHLVKKLFKTLSSEELPCAACVCRFPIIELLLEPVINCREYACGNTTSPTLSSKNTMVNVAEILTYIVSSKEGRSFLKSVKMKTPQLVSQLSASSKVTQPKMVELNPCEILSDFTVRALKGEIRSSVFTSLQQEPVIESYLFLCRQLYNHIEQFKLMRCDDLAAALTLAWQQSIRNAELARTPTPNNGDPSNVTGSVVPKSNPVNVAGSSTGRLEANNEDLKWQNVLVDNLLNLAATPRGLLLLMQSGALDSCAFYMFGRYSKKLQVSRCEKFGYGVLVSRISGCAAGMRALNNAGFLSLFVSEIWSNIECCPDDRKIVHPYLYPTDPIDFGVVKTFNSLMNVLSSFPAVFELFHKVKLSTKVDYTLRDVPENVADLINRLVMVSNPSKMSSLFNEEQSHVFGLRLISSIFSSLDSMLLFRTQYNVEKVLLELQAANFEDEKYYLDMSAVERNHVLVKLLALGGSNERLLPPREVKKDCSDYKYPIFYKLPLPSAFHVPSSVNYSKASPNDLSKHLTSTESWDHGQKWLTNCAEMLLAAIHSKQPIRGSQVGDILDKLLATRLKCNSSMLIKPDLYGKKLDATSIQISQTTSAIDDLGVKMMAAYGSYLKLIPDSKDAELHLLTTLKKVTAYLTLHFKASSGARKNQVSCSKFMEFGQYPSMDWFAAVVHLMFLGDSKKSFNFLASFANCRESICVWPARGFLFRNEKASFANCDLEPLMYIVGNSVELVVEKQLPNVASAFRMSGYSPALIAHSWIRNCYINVLNWSDIVHYILLTVTCGVDYAVYYPVAILKHLEREILCNSQRQNLLLFLKEQAVSGFKAGDYVDFMKQLRSKYRTEILKDLSGAFV